MASVGSFSGLASGVQWRDMIEQIMELETRRTLAPVTNQLTAVEKRKTAWQGFNSVLTSLSTAATGLRDGTGFGKFSVSVAKSAANKDLLTVSASSTAAPGVYAVEVGALAKAEKLRTTGAFSSSITPMALAGTFHINGRSVTIAAGDTLTSVRDGINAVNSGSNPTGVTASIVTVSPTEQYLTLTAEATGTRGIELIDSGDGSSANGVLQQLGLLTGAQTANTKAGDATRHQTQRFESRTTAVAQMLGLSAPPATASIMVDGERVSVDLQNDSLSDILDKIDAAALTGGSGTVSEWVSETVGGETLYRLQTGTVTADPLDGDASQRIVELLGFVKGVRGGEIQAGADAEIEIDGLGLTRRTNTVSDAVVGLTLNLSTAEVGSVVDVKISRDLDAIVQNVKTLVDAFNGAMAFYESQRKPGAPLYANGSLRTAISSFRNLLLNDVPGLDASATEFTRTTIAGVSFTRKGTLELDTAKLTSALRTNFSEVKALFGSVGSTSASDTTFFAATDRTTAGTYAVNILQAATVASATGAAWGSTYDGSGADEMTVYDRYSGATATISLANGDTLDTVIAALNDRFDAEGMTLTASRSGSGQLVVTGSEYGAGASFTVAYKQGSLAWAGASPTGLNAGTFTGLDVMGTIGGHPSTGVGRVLTANSGTAAAGLAVSYTGTAVGAAGTVTYTTGVAGAIDLLAESFTDTSDGVIRDYIAALDRTTASLAQREADLEGRLARYEERLIRQFAAMEGAMAKLQSTGNWLAGQINSLPGYSKE